MTVTFILYYRKCTDFVLNISKNIRICKSLYRKFFVLLYILLNKERMVFSSNVFDFEFPQKNMYIEYKFNKKKRCAHIILYSCE